MADVIRLNDARLQVERKKYHSTLCSGFTSRTFSLPGRRCFGDAASALSQLDARLTQRQTSVGHWRPSKAPMIRTRKTGASALSRPPPAPLSPPSWQRKWLLINVQTLIGLRLTNEHRDPPM